jgi:hypothetical protein
MKKGLLLSALFFSINVFAISNPLRRICLEKQGHFFVADLIQDQVAACQLGHSVVGALELVYLAENLTTESVQNYSERKTTCVGNEIQIKTTDDGDFQTVCHYDDGSFIDLQSLQSGRDSGQNPELNAALGL